jgi:hypothetical protein
MDVDYDQFMGFSKSFKKETQERLSAATVNASRIG